MEYQAQRIQDNQKFLLKLLHLHIGNYYPLRKWLGIDYKGKIDEISHLSFGYNTRYFKKGKKWYKEQTRVYQHQDLGYKLNLLLDKIPQFSLILPALLQPSYSFLWLLMFILTTTTYQPPTADIKVDGSNPDTNYDTQGLSIYKLNPIRSFVRFNLTDLNAGITFSNATLGIYLSRSPGLSSNDTACCRMTRTNWTESATWNKYDGTNNWTTAGGDYTTTGKVHLTVGETIQWYTYSDIKDLVQYCFDNDSKYINLALIEDPITSSSGINFYDRGNSSYGPKLTVTYTVPTNFFPFF